MTHLVDLAQNEAELRRVIELAPKWKDANRHKQDNDGLGEQWGELVVSEYYIVSLYNRLDCV